MAQDQYSSLFLSGGFNEDPDPAFFSMRIQGANPMRIRVLVRLCRHKKLDFDMKNIGNLCHKTYLRRYKIFFEGLEVGIYSFILVNFLASRSPLILDTDPDPGEPNQ
jgi:hypothetical protein